MELALLLSHAGFTNLEELSDMPISLDTNNQQV